MPRLTLQPDFEHLFKIYCKVVNLRAWDPGELCRLFNKIVSTNFSKVVRYSSTVLAGLGALRGVRLSMGTFRWCIRKEGRRGSPVRSRVFGPSP
jgi:hypothetical protein